jgi:hypothetical protein
MRVLSSLLAVMLSSASLCAQNTVAGRSAELPCYHAQPRPACSVFLVAAIALSGVD